MASHLYEALDITRDATPEEVRKAYRKKALQTHPDRLPQGATDREKKDAEEQFRKVNNAYEVLSDEQKRKDYDRFGVWPPQVREEPRPSYEKKSRHHSRGRSFPSPHGDPFFDTPLFGFDPFSNAFPHSRSPREFTDPFVLFNSMFSDFFRHADPFESDFFNDIPRSSPFGHPVFSHDPFQMLSRPSPLFEHDPFLLASGFGNDPFSGHGQSTSFQSSSRGYIKQGGSNAGRWVSESRMTRTINGVSQSVWKRSDSNGNEHVTYTNPDGTERYLINGIEQAPPIQSRHPSDRERALPPPPPYPGEQLSRAMPSRERDPVMKHSHSPFSSGSTRRHREREVRDMQEMHPDDHHKKKWWRGHWSRDM